MVRLKDAGLNPYLVSNVFQFLMVRLKVGLDYLTDDVISVSIPYGSIKRSPENSANSDGYLCFNSLWFD